MNWIEKGVYTGVIGLGVASSAMGLGAGNPEYLIDNYDNAITASEEYKKINENSEYQEEETIFNNEQVIYNELLEEKDSFLMDENEVREMIGDFEKSNGWEDYKEQQNLEEKITEAAEIIDQGELVGELNIETVKSETENCNPVNEIVSEGSDILNTGVYG